MATSIGCDIVTRMNISCKVDLKENEKDILNRINSSFDLNYYNVTCDYEQNSLKLRLKEDVVNPKLQELFKELFTVFEFNSYLCYRFLELNDCSKIEKRKAIEKFLNNDFDMFISKKDDQYREDNYNYVLKSCGKLEYDYDYYFDNYFYCIDMCDNLSFDDDLDSYGVLNVYPYSILFYLDFSVSDSEDITFTLRTMNHLLKRALKSELKNIIMFGLIG